MNLEETTKIAKRLRKGLKPPEDITDGQMLDLVALFLGLAVNIAAIAERLEQIETIAQEKR